MTELTPVSNYVGYYQHIGFLTEEEWSIRDRFIFNTIQYGLPVLAGLSGLIDAIMLLNGVTTTDAKISWDLVISFAVVCCLSLLTFCAHNSYYYDHSDYRYAHHKQLRKRMNEQENS